MRHTFESVLSCFRLSFSDYNLVSRVQHSLFCFLVSSSSSSSSSFLVYVRLLTWNKSVSILGHNTIEHWIRQFIFSSKSINEMRNDERVGLSMSWCLLISRREAADERREWMCQSFLFLASFTFYGQWKRAGGKKARKCSPWYHCARSRGEREKRERERERQEYFLLELILKQSFLLSVCVCAFAANLSAMSTIVSVLFLCLLTFEIVYGQNQITGR